MKAILVIDIPKNCEECKLTYIHTRKDTRYCCLTDREVEYRNDIDNCPLKPMPMKRRSAVDWLHHESMTAVKTYNPSEYDKGWNDCVDFLEGEEYD